MSKPPTTSHQPPTILVTGGAGYIGSITVKELLDSDYKVVVLDNLEIGHKEAVDKRAVLEVADLGSQKRVVEILRQHDPVAVIDFAAYIAVGESMTKPKKYLDNNVLNFVKLLDAMQESGVKYLIKSSTAAVYGSPASSKSLPLKETYTDKHKQQNSELLQGKWGNRRTMSSDFFQKVLDYYWEAFSDRPELTLTPAEIDRLKIPTSIYGLTKLLDEIIMKKYDKLSGMKSIILRYFNVAGADPSGKLGQDTENPTHIFASSIFQLLGKKDTLTIFGNGYPTEDGTGVRDYIHVNDLASGHIAALKYLIAKKKSDIFNLGTGDGYSVLDVISAVEKASGKKVNYSFGPRRSGDVSTLYSDPAKADKILKWKAQYSLADMASTAWQWHSKNPEGYDS